MRSAARITRETQMLAKDPPPGISAGPRPENYRYFDVMIEGPQGTPFEGGSFKLELFLPEEYPLKPPKVRFVTPIYHPNIDKLGRICLSVLKLPQDGQDNSSGWTPALNIRTTLLSIQLLLCEPNIEDPLDPNVAAHWRDNRKEAEQQAREWTRKYA